MKILTDKILRECLEQVYQEARLGRMDGKPDRKRVFAKALAEFEASGNAMRYMNIKGQIAWKATPRLREHLEGLRLDAEEELEGEDI